MLLKFVAPLSGSHQVFATDPANRGFDPARARDLLSRLSVRGDTIEILDGDHLSREELASLYTQAVEPVVAHKVPGSIRQVFGSRSAGMGPHFGQEVPALIVYEGDRPVDVYPRKDGESFLTIMSFLEHRASMISMV